MGPKVEYMYDGPQMVILKAKKRGGQTQPLRNLPTVLWSIIIISFF